jgi:ribosome biogenesis GTPase / thiamine phosphate phosphatase
MSKNENESLSEIEWHEENHVIKPNKVRSSQRILFKKQKKLSVDTLRGRIVSSIGKVFYVKIIETKDLKNPSKGLKPSNGSIIECSIAGTLVNKNKGATIAATGDYVYFTLNKSNLERYYEQTAISRGERPLAPTIEQPHSSTIEQSLVYTGLIVAIEERTSWLSRKPLIGIKEDVIAANIDNLIILASAAEPVYNRRLIDRFLVAAEFGEIAPILCINKVDLFDSPEMRKDFVVYEKMGVPVFFISSKTGKGILELMKFIKDHDSVISGSSGVGKSTLINKIFDKDIMSVKAVSEQSGKGKHTTSFVRMIEFPDSKGSIIDTPGIREFGITGVRKEDLALLFYDFEKFYGHCRFMPCTHTHEPGCAVKEAAESGVIDPQRYESYLNIYNSME